MPLPESTSIDTDVMWEQLDFLIMCKRTHEPGCGCRECWRYDRVREVLMMPFNKDYHEVKHTLKAKEGRANAAD